MVSLLAGESSEVPGRMLQTSFGSRRPSTTTLSQVGKYRPATALRYRLNTFGRLRDLFGRRSYFVELFEQLLFTAER